MRDKTARQIRILELFKALEGESTTVAERERLTAELDDLVASSAGYDAIIFMIVVSLGVAFAFGWLVRWLVG